VAQLVDYVWFRPIVRTPLRTWWKEIQSGRRACIRLCVSFKGRRSSRVDLVSFEVGAKRGVEGGGSLSATTDALFANRLKH
jgi:hypothetical protein